LTKASAIETITVQRSSVLSQVLEESMVI
jgi:hypothetical protein